MTRPRPWRAVGIRHRMPTAALTHLRHAVLLAALCALAGLAALGSMPLSQALARPVQALPGQPQADDSVLVIATCDWPPYAERHLPHGGYAVQIIRAALAAAGLEARFEFMPWARGMALLREGQVAAVAPAYKTTGRESECDLSAPFPGGPLTLFALAGNARRWTDLRDLADLRIGVVRGYAHTDAFDEAPFLNKEAANDETANLRKLMAGRIDAMAADRNVVHYRLRRDLSGDPATLAEFDPVLGERDLYVCFARTRPGHAALRAAFDKGLAAVRAAGLVDELHREMRRLAGEQPAGQ
ncbi:substrate-binding periplasmic protein [Nitratidesulfovibrio sp. D1]|uniref:substrate-binding periplasmic protein n=1 Tax=Nitratidesulfovibrio sp. D1 TaxID=3440151 RepID=UPI003EBFB955